MKRLTLFLSVVPFLLLVGCAFTGGKGAPGMVMTTEAFKLFSGEFENTPYFKDHKPKSIAVLPFAKGTQSAWSAVFDQEHPDQIVRRGMYNHISSLPFQDLEMFETDRRLKNAGFDSPQALAALVKQDPKKLKSILGVDAVILGEVTHFNRTFVGLASMVEVGCEITMWDLSSGNLLWRAKQNKKALAGGISLNPLWIAIDAAAAIWNLRQSSMLEQTDNLFREVVSTIELPQSALALEVTRPQIDLFACLNAQKPFKAGEKISFRLIGDPNCRAYVDLGDYKSGIELTPLSPEMKTALAGQLLEQVKQQYFKSGQTLTPELESAIKQALTGREIYQGSYTVAQKELADQLLAKGYLINQGGGQSSEIDVQSTIFIDAVPPQVPANLKAISLNGKIDLAWDGSKESDLNGYEVQISLQPISGFSRKTTSECPRVILTDLANFAPIYLRVLARDKADNLSAPSQAVQALPLPEPGLYDLPQPGPIVPSEISEKILLRAEKGPFLIRSDVTVRPGGALILEPGTQLKFAPKTSLKVSGGDFLAYGLALKPIRFSPEADAAKAGAYQGVILEGPGRMVLEHIIVEKAATGISISQASPQIENAIIRQSSQAGIHLLGGAKPVITCSVFDHNQGMGAIVIEGEGIDPQIHRNQFTNNEPFHIQSLSPMEIDCTGNFWGAKDLDPSFIFGERLRWQPALTAPPMDCAGTLEKK